MGRLDVDLRCISCGYNLRGLAHGGICGECGKPVSWSVRGNFLFPADLRWISSVRLAAGVMVVLLPWLWIPLVSIPFGIGLFRLMSPDPRSCGRIEVVTRELLRLVLVMTVTVAMTFLVPAAEFAAYGSGPYSLAGVAFGLGCVWALTSLVTTFAIRRHVARKNPPRMRSLCNAIITCAGFAIAAVFASAALSFGTKGVFAAFALAKAAAFLGFLCVLVTIPLVWLLLFWTWRALHVAEANVRVAGAPRAWTRPVPGGRHRSDASMRSAT